jgi:ribosomal protein S27E
MNTTDPTNAQFAAYRAMWSYFNAVLFGGELAHVILNFSRLARSLGFFAPERWRDDANAVTHEISLNPAHLRRDNLKDAASTLVHEMAHAWRHAQPKPPRNGYHDVVWADKMEALGLMPSDTAAPGGSRLGYKMSHYIIAGGAFERAFDAMPAACHLPWTCGIDDEARGAGGGEKKAKKAKKEQEAARKVKVKYSCPGCSLNVWGRAGLKLSCEDCDQALACADGGAVDERGVTPVRKAATQDGGTEDAWGLTPIRKAA